MKWLPLLIPVVVLALVAIGYMLKAVGVIAEFWGNLSRRSRRRFARIGLEYEILPRVKDFGWRLHGAPWGTPVELRCVYTDVSGFRAGMTRAGYDYTYRATLPEEVVNSAAAMLPRVLNQVLGETGQPPLCTRDELRIDDGALVMAPDTLRWWRKAELIETDLSFMSEVVFTMQRMGTAKRKVTT
jgi:hypothetical protein